MTIDFMYLGIVLLVVLLSMTLHEAMHAFMSYWLGDDTAKREGRLTLNPVKHLDPFLSILLPLMLAVLGGPIFGGAKPVPFRPENLKWGEWGAALMAAAGPLTNLLLAFIAYGIWVMVGVNSGGLLGTFLSLSVLVNLGFFVFNMIPIPPLDGSRVLYALAPDFVRNIMSAIERLGIVFIFAIVLLAGSILGTYMGSAINFFLGLFRAIFGA